MTTRPYYRNFKEAPNGLLDSIEELTDVDIAYGHVGVDNSLFLDLVQTDSLPVTAKQILMVAAAVGADLDDAFIEPSQLVEGGLSVSFAATMFDFSGSYRGTPQEDSPFFGVGLHDGEVRPEPSATQQVLIARLQEQIDAEAPPTPDDAIDAVEYAIDAVEYALRGFFGALQAEEDAAPEGVGDVLVIDNGDGSGMILIVGDEDDGDVVAFNDSEIPGPVVFFDDEDLLPPSPESVDGACFDGACESLAPPLPGVEDSPEAVAAEESLFGIREDEAVRREDEAAEALVALAMLCALLETASEDELDELERVFGGGQVGFGG